jgi:single-strand DNA-binding protein
MNEDVITVVGGLGGDPTLKSVNGERVAEFRLASKSQRKDGDVYVDVRTNWYSVEAWGRFAEHVAGSLRKGDLVVVVGKLRVEQWESGDRRGTSVKIRADHIGPSLRTGAVAKDRRPREQELEHGALVTDPATAAGGDLEPAMAYAGERSGPVSQGAAQEAWSAPLSEPDTPF